MKLKKVHLILFTFFLIALLENKIKACSMYKITVDGKTVVGCNHDTWLYTPKIWFEDAKKAEGRTEFMPMSSWYHELSVSNTKASILVPT